MIAHAPPKTLKEALAFIDWYIEGSAPSTSMPVASSLGHVLSEDIFAPVSLPRFNSAAMDGFAVRASDIASDGSALLTLGQTIAAGLTSVRELEHGEAARIMTGAPVPAGAERVIVQEESQIVEDKVRLRTQVGGKPHIRLVGEDIAVGDEVLKAGTRISPGSLALLTALGIESIEVFRKPKVALLSTGDELVESPGPLAAGQIYDTNRPMLKLMLEAAGADVTDLGIVRDDPNAIVSALVAAASEHDLIVSSGGASEGFADHLARAVSQRGFLEFWKLDMRPGKPIGFGDVDHCPILLLPGNPLAAAVGCALFGRSIVMRLEGKTPGDRSVLRLPLGRSVSKPLGRTQIHVGRLELDSRSGRSVAHALPEQGSASLRSLSAADILIILQPEQTDIEEGELVDVVPLWQSF